MSFSLPGQHEFNLKLGKHHVERPLFTLRHLIYILTVSNLVTNAKALFLLSREADIDLFHLEWCKTYVIRAQVSVLCFAKIMPHCLSSYNNPQLDCKSCSFFVVKEVRPLLMFLVEWSPFKHSSGNLLQATFIQIVHTVSWSCCHWEGISLAPF